MAMLLVSYTSIETFSYKFHIVLSSSVKLIF